MLFHVNHLGFRRLKQIILKLPKSRIVSGRGHRRCAAKGSDSLWKPVLLVSRESQGRVELGSALINPPAAKPFFSGWLRRKEKIDLAVFQYSFAQFFPCSLPAKKARLFADGGLMSAEPSYTAKSIWPLAIRLGAVSK